MTDLVKYEAACRAIAAAKDVDEVKQIRDASIAMKAYARQAKNHTMEADAIEIRMRATRRMDQMRRDQKATVGLAKGGTPYKSTGLAKSPVEKPTLAEAGIDKNLAHEGRKLGALSDQEFEKAISTARDAVGSIIKTALRTDDKVARRAAREEELSAKQLAWPTKIYGVIYADPEWRFEPYSRETGMDRAVDNHYPTSTVDVIKARDVASIAADDCALFLWSTAPMQPQAYEVMAAWGFDYKSQVVWDKGEIGTGYWFRNRHEILLVGTRGDIPAPAPGTQWPSIVEAPIGAPGEKPEAFYELIESYFPNLPKIELNARRRRPSWDAWGFEAPDDEAAA
jgi:N6-adenosine-specific RNA methylase IME4